MRLVSFREVFLMHYLNSLDWGIIFVVFIVYIVIGVKVSKKSGDSSQDYFLAGRSMAWWLLGISMVATTFSSDTANIVTDLVRKDGVAGNWAWWIFLIIGMFTTFVYAKLWRRSKLLTDLEFYELRYSGKAVGFLRGFRAIYLGFIFNTVAMGSTALAAVKFGEILLGIPGWVTIVVGCTITACYSYLGGLKAVLVTDVVQFCLAMVGSVLACIYLLGTEQIQGLENLLANPVVQEKWQFIPQTGSDAFYTLIVIPLVVLWWSSYYPGAEPGGGSYVAQRMFSAKDEKNSLLASLLFNFMHYAVRPWPWILVALASLIVFPDLKSIQEAFPNVAPSRIADDIAYPAMLTLLPNGLLGVVAVSLIAAFMSTMSTYTNLGASYIVNDVYKPFIKPKAKEKELVQVGRYITVVSMFLGGGLGLLLKSAGQAFTLVLLLGAGTGAIYLLRWFWWRINAITEIIVMVASIVISVFFTFIYNQDWGWNLSSPEILAIGALINTSICVVSAFLFGKTDPKVLQAFYKKITPASWGWSKVVSSIDKKDLPETTVSLENKAFLFSVSFAILGSIGIYALLLGGGWLLEKSYVCAFGSIGVGVICLAIILLNIKKLNLKEEN